MPGLKAGHFAFRSPAGSETPRIAGSSDCFSVLINAGYRTSRYPL